MLNARSKKRSRSHSTLECGSRITGTDPYVASIRASRCPNSSGSRAGTPGTWVMRRSYKRATFAGFLDPVYQSGVANLAEARIIPSAR